MYPFGHDTATFHTILLYQKSLCSSAPSSSITGPITSTLRWPDSNTTRQGKSRVGFSGWLPVICFSLCSLRLYTTRPGPPRGRGPHTSRRVQPTHTAHLARKSGRFLVSTGSLIPASVWPVISSFWQVGIYLLQQNIAIIVHQQRRKGI